MQVLYSGRVPRTKETRPPFVFRGLTGSQRTPGFWGVTLTIFFFLIMQIEISLIQNCNISTSEHINQTSKNIRG